MADQPTGLPIRSEADGAGERVHVKVCDSTTPTQQLAVDASGAASVNHAKVSGTVVAVGNGVSGTGVQRVTIASDSTGQVALAAGAAIIGSLAANQSVDMARIAGTATSVGSGIITAGTIRVTIATDQSAVPVAIGNPTGTVVNDPKNAAAIAAGATDNHDYTVTVAKALTLRNVVAAASGKMKVEVFLNAVSKWVQFNSTANPNIQINLNGLGITVAATQVVRVACTNLDNQAQNLYSTITGTEV